MTALAQLSYLAKRCRKLPVSVGQQPGIGSASVCFRGFRWEMHLALEVAASHLPERLAYKRDARHGSHVCNFLGDTCARAFEDPKDRYCVSAFSL
jgi:hypothetical protein